MSDEKQKISRRDFLKLGGASAGAAALAAVGSAALTGHGTQPTPSPEGEFTYFLETGKEWPDLFKKSKGIDVEAKNISVFQINGTADGQKAGITLAAIPQVKGDPREAYFEKRLFVQDGQNNGGLRELLPVKPMNERTWAKFPNDEVPTIKSPDGNDVFDFSAGEPVLIVRGQEKKPAALVYKWPKVSGAEVQILWPHIPDDFKKFFTSKQ